MWDRFERRGSENDTNNNNSNKKKNNDDDNDDNTDTGKKHYTINAKQQQTHNTSNVAWFIASEQRKRCAKCRYIFHGHIEHVAVLFSLIYSQRIIVKLRVCVFFIRTAFGRIEMNKVNEQRTNKRKNQIETEGDAPASLPDWNVYKCELTKTLVTFSMGDEYGLLCVLSAEMWVCQTDNIDNVQLNWGRWQ